MIFKRIMCFFDQQFFILEGSFHIFIINVLFLTLNYVQNNITILSNNFILSGY